MKSNKPRIENEALLTKSMRHKLGEVYYETLLSKILLTSKAFFPLREF